MGYEGLQGVKNGLQEVTRGYRRLQGVTGVLSGYKGDRGLQRIIGLERITGGFSGLQKVTGVTGS